MAGIDYGKDRVVNLRLKLGICLVFGGSLGSRAGQELSVGVGYGNRLPYCAVFDERLGNPLFLFGGPESLTTVAPGPSVGETCDT
jgi:hypothetical protein